MESPAPYKILHVDDDHVMRLMTKTALSRSSIGFSVESCASAKEALEKIPSFSPDILLIDMVMPIMDGIVLLQTIRNKEWDFQKIPAVFVTGKEMGVVDEREKLEPILGIILKPFSPTLLGEDLLNLWKKYHNGIQEK
ncbi:MAG: hypothetical protein AUJ12_08170 [Alphaproteobacteria bacterium CG1_02_46_17]|nr:MAG: hypothetical protein AUJ12_08170 [Alphaproteobacteria bacterium CG1_02_46_17]